MSKRTPVSGFENTADKNLRRDDKVFMALGSCGLKTNSTLKKINSITFGILGVLVLSGCASVGTFGGLGSAPGVDRSLVTASTGTAVEEQLDQAIPGALNNNIATTAPAGPYMPPGNVGGSLIAVPIAVASVSSSQLPPLVPNSSPIVPGAAPLAQPQSTFVGSQQAMPAQTQNAISPARVTQPFQDSSVPQIASGGNVPTLSVVPNDGYKHTVESGESLYAIARRYNVKTDDIVRVNGLSSADQIFVGQKIIIPGREDLLGSVPTATAAPTTPEAAQEEPVQVATIAPVITAPAQTAPGQTAPGQTATGTQANGFRWPVNGRVIVNFEQSRRTGINIEAPEGAAVRAAEDGTVIYVGDGIEGFGNLVLVRHANGYVSAYAHLKGFSIANDTQVRRGDQLGTVGMTGTVNRPQLHFELRQGATPVDPMPLLAT